MLMSFIYALIVGASLGLLGGGGSILTVPIFVYGLEIDEKPAIAMSLAAVGLIALIGALLQSRKKNVLWMTGLVFGLFAMAGAYMGALIANYMSGTLQMIIFAVVMLMASVAMLRGRKEPSPEQQNKNPFEPKILLIIGIEGIATGILTGIVGVGGGFLIVPALAILGGLTMQQAVGTSLFVIAMKSTTGLVGYLQKIEITADQWETVVIFAVVGSIGSVSGAYLSNKIPSKMLKKIFGVFLIIMASYIMYTQIEKLNSADQPADRPVNVEATEKIVEPESEKE